MYMYIHVLFHHIQLSNCCAKWHRNSVPPPPQPLEDLSATALQIWVRILYTPTHGCVCNKKCLMNVNDGILSKNELRLNIFQFPMFPGNYGIIHFDLLILSHVQFRFHRSPPIERVFRMHLGHRPPSQAAAKTWSDHTIHRQKTTVYIVYIYHILIYDSDLLILYLHYKQTTDIYHIYIIHSISHDASLSSVFSIISKNSHLVQPTTSKRSSHQHSQTLPGSL